MTQQQTREMEACLAKTEQDMQQLLNILHEEKQNLSENNIDSLESIAENKLEVTARINEHEQVRLSILTSLDINPEQPEKWLISGKLQDSWKAIKETAKQSQKLNHIIGIIISGNKNRVQKQLAILQSTPVPEITYSQSGSCVNQTSSTTLARV